MSDTKFEFGTVANSYMAIAQRGAVLNAFANRILRPEQVVLATQRLQRVWRFKLQQVRPELWGLTATRRVFARNCPPPFAGVRPPRRPCQLYRFCPFCHARWAGQMWQLAAGVFPPLDPFDGPAAYHLLEGTDRMSLAYWGAAGPSDHWADLEPPLLKFLEEYQSQRRRRVAAYGLQDGLVYLTIEPGKFGDWQISDRWLFRVPADWQPPAGGRLQYRRVEQITRQSLLGAVIRTCRYPFQLLRHPTPELVIALLRAMRAARFRTSATYGAFRAAGRTSTHVSRLTVTDPRFVEEICEAAEL